MELLLRNDACKLVASIDCTGAPNQLESGNVGWFRVKEIQWLHNWKLKVQVSITLRPGDGPQGDPVEGRDEARAYVTNSGPARLVVEHDIVEYRSRYRMILYSCNALTEAVAAVR